MKNKMTARRILDALKREHSGHLFIEELRAAAGFGVDAERRIDAWAMDPTPSKGNKRTSYEIKISRSDFLRDIKKPHKHRPALTYSNEFYFVAPKGLLKTTEMPLFAGLIEIYQVNYVELLPRLGCSYSLMAPWRDTVPPSWRFVASLARSIERQR